jgi:hypothetical protein
VSPVRFFEISIEFLIHELKDPISIIETGLRTVLEKQDQYGPLSTKQANTLMRSLQHARKARGLLHDLLEIGRSRPECPGLLRFLRSVRAAGAQGSGDDDRAGIRKRSANTRSKMNSPSC